MDRKSLQIIPLALGVLLALGAFWIFSSSSTGGNPAESRMLGVSKGSPDSSLEQLNLERKPNASETPRSVVLVDLLSQKEVNPIDSLRFESNGGPEWTLPFSSANLGERLLDFKPNTRGTFSYLAPSVEMKRGVPWSTTIENALIEEDFDGQIRLSLPLLPTVTVDVFGANGAPVEGAPVVVVLLSDKDFLLAQAEAQANLDLAKTPYPFRQIENMLFTFEKGTKRDFSQVNLTTDEAGQAKTVLSGAGLMVVIIPDPKHKLYWQAHRVSPGDNGHVICNINPRPKVMGRITYLDGTPAPGVTISLATYLIPESVDFSSVDRGSGNSLTGVRMEDGSVHQVTRKSIRTNSNGEYESTLSFGLEYMLEVKTENHYSSVIHPNGDLNKDGVLIHDFVIPSPLDSALLTNEDLVSLEVLGPDGLPLHDATLKIAPYLDAPWFRIYPEVNTGSEGYVDLPWVAVGDTLYVLTYHKSWIAFTEQEVEITGSLISMRVTPQKEQLLKTTNNEEGPTDLK